MKQYERPTIEVEQIECEGIMEPSKFQVINFSELFGNDEFQWK